MPCFGVVAQLVRASACHAEGRGFEPRQSRQLNEKRIRKNAFFVLYKNYLLWYNYLNVQGEDLSGVRCFFAAMIYFSCCGVAGAVTLGDALRTTYTACVGIDDQLSDLKRMAGINTVVTGVGTATGIGATATGLVKASKDKQIAEIERLLQEIDQIQSAEESSELTTADKNQFLADFARYYDTALGATENYQAQLDKLTQQSKRLGNWRTGLLAGTTSTSTAGAIIAGGNKVGADLQTQIDTCVTAVSDLRAAIMQARFDGVDVTEATEIANACGEYEYVDITPINRRAVGATVSGALGAGTGLVGTIISGVANTDKTRDGDARREQNLNTAANVLSAGATAASATATVFNATQIAAIKKVANVATKCTGVLK